MNKPTFNPNFVWVGHQTGRMTSEAQRLLKALIDILFTRTGVDDAIVTGTAGTTNHLAKWNVDGDLVDSVLAVDGTGNVTGVLSIGGTATNDDAAAGKIGEYASSIVASNSVSLTTNTAADVTTLSLTAGDWDVNGSISYLPTTTTSITRLLESISLTSNTRDTTAGSLAAMTIPATVPGTASDLFFRRPVGPVRISIAATTTVYLVATAIFSASTLTCGGILRARRVR